ncbi:22047_t:CDS:2, partial [Gigaspora rosea]
ISNKENLAPSSTITLICLVKGNSFINAFPIDINKNKLIDQLKLWKVEIPDEDEDMINGFTSNDHEILLPTKPICKYFKKPQEKHIQIIISSPNDESRLIGVSQNLSKSIYEFPIPRHMNNDELNHLKDYSTIEDNQFYLNKGVIANADSNLYSDGKYVGLSLPSELMDNFGGILCLPDTFFLGRGPARSDCAITGTPGENFVTNSRQMVVFLLIDAQPLKFLYEAYMVLLTSPKAERYDKAIKWPGLPKAFLDRRGPIPRSVLAKWDDESYQAVYEQIVAEVDYEKCLNSINKFGMPEDAIRVHNKIIRDYEYKIRRDVRDFVMCCDGFSNVSGFRGNLFEVLPTWSYKGNDGDSKITEKKLKKLECNVFTTLNEVNKERYNKPNSKTFASIDSFSLDNNDLALFQIMVSKNHGVK